MKILFVLLSLTLSHASSGQVKNPFLTLRYDTVIMYDFEGGKGSDILIVDDNGKLANSITKQVTPDKVAIAKLNAKLGDKKSYGAATAFCFDPHVGFVYYLKGKVVGQVTICLDCNRLVSSIDIPAQKQGKQGHDNHAYYTLNGMSKSFRKFINELLIKNEFSHQIVLGSGFDE